MKHKKCRPPAFFYSPLNIFFIKRRLILAYYNKEIADIFKETNSSENGLSDKQVEQNRLTFGSNQPEQIKKVNLLVKFFVQFKNVMILILIASAILSCIMAISQHDLENLFEAILIFVIVIINAIVGVIQEQKAENALLALQKSTIPFAKTIRNGKLSKIKIHEIVVGDIVSLKAGDFIPADIRLISSNNLRCDESSLTGESQDASKDSKTLKSKGLSIASQSNMCFSGTTVKNGFGTGIVVAVGKDSEFGKIAKALSNTKKEKTPLEKNIDKIGRVITISVLVIVAIVFLVQVFFNKNSSLIESLLIAITLAVAAIPESLPAVITIIMALGVQRLAKQNAIVKKLSAVETLGCCNVICTDKTGTLTQNKMSVDYVCCNANLFAKDEFKIDNNKTLIDIAAVCNSIDPNTLCGGDASEQSIINFLKNQNVDFAAIKKSYKIVKINEFNSSKKCMSVLVKQNEEMSLLVKGAIDYILPKCNNALVGGTIQELSIALKKKILSYHDHVCEMGERVIALAIKQSGDLYDENNLTFVGFIGIIDPPRKEVYNAIKQNQKAGIKTIMITGDHPATAFAIGNQLGISKSKSEVLTGRDIDNLSIKELSSIVENYSIFARVSPEHKLKIVEALKLNKKIVAMTGDGVNDAPSVKNANIGICMGITGTDVTKEAADLIISDDNYATITTAIKQGRTIYRNITKTILFLISTNLVEVLGIFITSLLMPDSIFLLPTQILFINLVTDSLPAFALGLEKPEKDIMNQAPRDSNKSILVGTTGSSIIYQGFIQTLVVLVMFVFASHRFGNEVASTMSFLTICLMQIIHSINCKTEKSLFKINVLNNSFLNFSFLFLLGLILSVYFIPALASLFSLTKLNPFQWILVIVTSLMIIPSVELGKLCIKA